MKALTKFKRVAVAACAVAAGLFAHAATEKTSYWAWNETKQAVVEQAPVDAAVLDDILGGAGAILPDGWYVVKGELFVDSNIIVDTAATVNLILADDAEFNLSDSSLIVNEGSTLNIYGQAKNTGKLIVDRYMDGDAPSVSYDAAIGGAKEQPNGEINIHGGVIKAKGWGGAGIGAGGAECEEDLPDQEGSITFYGGVVNAYSRNGAGIGGGSDAEPFNKGGYGNGGVVRTYGGVVVGRTGTDSLCAGIGGGCSGNGGSLYIDGACIVGANFDDWSASNPAHGFGKGYFGVTNGTLIVDRSAKYNDIKCADIGDSDWGTTTADKLESDVKDTDWKVLNKNVYYFSWERKITIKGSAPCVKTIEYSIVQQDGTESATNTLTGDQPVTTHTFYGLDDQGKIGYPENVGVSNGVHVVYTCEDGYTFQDGKKTAEVWIHPTRVRGDIKLEVGGDERAPYVIPAPVREKSYYKLSMPDVEDASWTVTTNGVKVADLQKILKGTTVLVTWTARPGYVITSGATETFTMTADYTAKTPTVVRVTSYALTLPEVEHATAEVTTNGVLVIDLSKIAIGAKVTVTWTAAPGYVITAGETEEIVMDGDKTAKEPTVEKLPEPQPEPEPEAPFTLFPAGDGGKFVAAVKSSEKFNGAIISSSNGVEGTIQLTLKKPNKKTGLFDIQAKVVTLVDKATYSFKAKGLAAPTNGVLTAELQSSNGKSAGHKLVVTLDGCSLTGTFDSFQIDGARDVFAAKDAAKMAAVKPFADTYWTGVFGDGVSNDQFVAGFSVTIKSKSGKASVKVLDADGKSMSCNAVCEVGANGAVAVPVTVRKSAKTAAGSVQRTFGFRIAFGTNGVASCCTPEGVVAPCAAVDVTPMRDWAKKTDPAKAAVYSPVGFVAADKLAVTPAAFKDGYATAFAASLTNEVGSVAKTSLKLAKTGFITGSVKVDVAATGKSASCKAAGVVVGTNGVGVVNVKQSKDLTVRYGFESNPTK